ncbi:unnamed protein product [Dovyalis caffra]|uniref:Uncharacterized protein n=1 Tax=Dovyalis caffra TaxID=77055 RepID=A0AAV1QRT2_9ROSI|nr:unnamed protein product [Dovyalis caffra]
MASKKEILIKALQESQQIGKGRWSHANTPSRVRHEATTVLGMKIADPSDR